MAHRHWIACYNISHPGVTTEKEIDLLEDFSEEELATMSDKEAEDYIAVIAYEMAFVNISASAKKA